jgi:hypothetical protein
VERHRPFLDRRISFFLRGTDEAEHRELENETIKDAGKAEGKEAKN